MRFKASIQNISIFTKLTASLNSLGNFAWVKLSDNQVCFTIIPEQGTQVWAVLSIDSIFEVYNIQSAANNVVNLEVPLASLTSALRSALQATSASIRLTKKDNIPLLALTIITTSSINPRGAISTTGSSQEEGAFGNGYEESAFGRERETIVTQEIPVKVLSADSVSGLHEPRCREPDVHIMLPPLAQIKGISDRFTKLASVGAKAGAGLTAANAPRSRLELSANMHGCLKLSIRTDAMNISSVWTGLTNPELDPSQVQGGEEGIAEHPSTRMKALGSADGRSDEGWATVRIDGRDWGKVMSVGRLGGRVIACFCHEHALILYVYLPNDNEGEDESVLTYYMSSYSA
ncbi:Hus1-like protein [Mytilinidion resinicola]|uniref:Checkpoint protein n=1 Tax=Mytilinidion resinicola TaxID=574789 RepID=A0A6A6YPV4_9PEZI|nr:Hus1-like protein [Mytilinidion resinicola]KAF2810781.1 Hus1-like protein [Mytilinidion resinicola]